MRVFPFTKHEKCDTIERKEIVARKGMEKEKKMSHLEKFRAALAEKGADAAVIGSKLNQRYLSDFDFDDGFVLVTKGQSYLITDFRYVEAANEQRDPGLEVLTPNFGMLNCMRELLHENGCRTVMIEEDTLSFGDYEKYCEKLGEVKLISGASALLDELRLYKDERELERMVRAQAITDAAFTHIVNFIKPEMTEIEVALELDFFMRRNGADALAFETIAVSGTSSSRPHGVPGRRKLEKGFLTMDFGAQIGGYCSDMTRTLVIGRADAEMKKLYNTVLRAQTESLAAYCEGASCAALDKIARDIIDGVPEYRGTFGHSLGHGVGLFIHENPRVSSRAGDAVLARGNVVTCEPGIYLEGKYGCRIEDMVAIRPDGSVYNFTHSTKELIEV